MQREILKGAAFGGVVMAVSLTALSLVDPRQPSPVVALAPTQAAPNVSDTTPKAAAPAAQVDVKPSAASEVSPQTRAALADQPKKADMAPAVVQSAAPDVAGDGTRAAPAPAVDPAHGVTLPAPEPIARAAAAPNLTGPSPEAAAKTELSTPLPTIAANDPPNAPQSAAAPDAAAVLPVGGAAALRPRNPAALGAPQPPVALAPAISQLTARLIAPDLPGTEAGRAAAAQIAQPVPRVTPILAAPAIEIGLPPIDLAGAPPAPSAEALSSNIIAGSSRTAEPAWSAADAESELSLPELREAPPPPSADLSLQGQPAPAQIGATLNLGRDLAILQALDDPAATVPDDGPARELDVLVAKPLDTPMAEAALAPMSPPEPQADLPALERYAAAVSVDPDLPMLGLALLDDGHSFEASLLEDLPFKASIILDAAQTGAAEAMQRYRAAGHEVILLAPLRSGASADEAGAALRRYMTDMPEAALVAEAVAGGLNPTPSVALSIAEVLQASGHGLLLWQTGLNPVEGFAAGFEPPTAVIYRDIDGKGQDTRAILRFVDEAAARSAQLGAVVVLGRLQSETLAALSRWTETARAASVSLVPVSSVLLRP